MKTMDGNEAVAHIAYAFSDFAVVYPITPSSPMAEITDKWSAESVKTSGGALSALSLQSSS
jgi:pyruvate-ferredoxin/flavodoxin oxidoreductase